MMKFSFPSTFNILYSIFCGSLFSDICPLSSGVRKISVQVSGVRALRSILKPEISLGSLAAHGLRGHR